jgi:hypothetical protein
MFRRTIFPALMITALASTTAWAQSASPGPRDDHGQQVMQKIHDDLTAKGLKDVRVEPGSFIVSGTDKNGKHVVMLIGPDSMTVLTPAEAQAPQQAQEKDPNLKNWE